MQYEIQNDNNCEHSNSSSEMTYCPECGEPLELDEILSLIKNMDNGYSDTIVTLLAKIAKICVSGLNRRQVAK